MPFAARFVQQGTIVPLHYVDNDAVTVFFPASSELFHALGILFMGNDILSPFINSAWMALALLAAWCIGRPFGVAPVTVTGAAVLFAIPGLVATQPGGAYDDVVGLALLLSCAALLIGAAQSDQRTRISGLAVAALAAGVAFGTKFTFIAPVAALTIGVAVLARRGRRRSEVGLWVLLVLVTGGFWYLRNLVIVGNPIPSQKVSIGPLALPSPAAAIPRSTFGHFLFNVSDWRHFFLPGLRLSFGPAWWALLPLAAAGLVLGVLAGPGRMAKMLSWVGLIAAAAFIVTPEYLAILGVPVYFVDNVRYADPGVVMGLVMLPLIPALRVGNRAWWILGAYVGTISLNQLDGTIWPISWLGQHFEPPISGVDSLIGLVIGVVVLAVALSLWLARRRQWRPPHLAVAAIIIALLGAGFSLQQFYLRNRYANTTSSSIVAWAQHISHSRIAVAGDLLQLQYGFYGRTLTNYVQYVAQPEPHHGFASLTSCEAWRKAINEGRYDYVVTSTDPAARRKDVFATPSSYTLWTGSDPSSTLLQRNIATDVSNRGNGGGIVYVGISLFRLTGELDPNSCPPSTAGSRTASAE
jgi:hypothetical protein